MSLPQRGEPEFWVSFLGAELPPIRFLSHFSFLEGEMKRTGGRRCLRRLPTFLLQVKHFTIPQTHSKLVKALLSTWNVCPYFLYFKLSLRVHITCRTFSDFPRQSSMILPA